MLRRAVGVPMKRYATTTVLEIATKIRTRSEKAEEALCVDFATRAGWDVVKLSQYQKPAGMTLGICDLYLESPDGAAGLWFEVKTEAMTSKMSRAQYRFIERRRRGNLAAVGTLHDLVTILNACVSSSSIWRGPDSPAALCESSTDRIVRRGFRGERKDGTPSRPRRKVFNP
jgi:hypothetical protein